MNSISKPINKPNIDSGNSLSTGLIFDALFYEGTGTTPLDLVSGNQGAISGTGAITWVQDLFGWDLNFAPTGNGITVGYPTATINSSIFTVQAAINPTSVATAAQAIIGSDTSGGIEFRLTTNTVALIKESITNIGASTGTVLANTWTDVAVTYDGSGNYIFYINAISSGSGTNAQTFNSGKATVGINDNPSGEGFTGNIAYVRVWNRALLGTEILSMYQNPFRIYAQGGILRTGLRPRAFAPGIAR